MPWSHWKPLEQEIGSALLPRWYREVPRRHGRWSGGCGYQVPSGDRTKVLEIMTSLPLGLISSGAGAESSQWPCPSALHPLGMTAQSHRPAHFPTPYQASSNLSLRAFRREGVGGTWGSVTFHFCPVTSTMETGHSGCHS